jgi:hypothetical protein
MTLEKKQGARTVSPAAVYDFWLIKEPSQYRSRAVLETPVILEIEGIEAGEVPLTSNIPKSLQIATRTSIGPMVVRISESGAVDVVSADELQDP